MSTLNPNYRYKNSCATPTAPSDVVVLQPNCNPIDAALINQVIDQILSNNLFIVNQSQETQNPGTFNVNGQGISGRFTSKKFELLNSSGQLIATLQNGTI